MASRLSIPESVLRVPELLGLCCDQLTAGGFLKSLRSLALTNRALNPTACEYLWAKHSSLLPLMLTLPQEIVSVNGTIVVSVAVHPVSDFSSFPSLDVPRELCNRKRGLEEV